MSQDNIEKINELTEKIALEPENAKLYSGRAVFYRENKDYDKAIKDWTRAIELDPEYARLYFYFIGQVYLERFDCYRENKDYDKAIKDYTRAIEVWGGGRSSFVYSVWEKDKDKAIEFYTKAIELEPENAKFYSDRGKCYRYSKNYDNAVKDYTKAIELQPENAGFYSDRALCYWLKNDDSKAEKDYTKAIELQPENAGFYSDRAFYYVASKEYDKAEKDYTKAIELQPENAGFYSKRGECYSAMKNYDNALKDYDKAIELYPKNAEDYSGRGRCYFEMKNYDEALKDYDKAIELDPKCVEAYLVYGKCYLERENYEEALKNFDKAVELDPKCAEAYETRGDCYHKQDNSKALHDYFNALKVMRWGGVANISHDYDLSGDEKAERIYSKARKLFKYENNLSRVRDILDICFSDSWYKDDLIEEVDLEINERKKIEHEREVAQARVDERNKVIADLSHSIKNLIKTVIDPLENLKQESVVKPQVIENALKGANLIREIVNAMNLSFRGSVEDFYYDAEHNTGKDSLDFQSVIVESLKYSAGNMFDGKYFGKYQKKYFPTKDSYLAAKSEWADVSQSNASAMNTFLKKHFFETDISFGGAERYVMGNDRGSAVKFMILFQEIILNAVKYVAFAEKEKRFLRIRFAADADHISVKVENRFQPDVKTETTGIGHVIVENFAKLMNAGSPVVNQNGDIYSVEIGFPNFWKKRKEQ